MNVPLLHIIFGISMIHVVSLMNVPPVIEVCDIEGSRIEDCPENTHCCKQSECDEHFVETKGTTNIKCCNEIERNTVPLPSHCSKCRSCDVLLTVETEIITDFDVTLTGTAKFNQHSKKLSKFIWKPHSLRVSEVDLEEAENLLTEHSMSADSYHCNTSIVGRITDFKLNEISGIVESHRYPNHFYSIEDNGNGNSVYLIHRNGTLMGTITLEGVKNNDFEDIAMYSSAETGIDYIFVGDVGNDWPHHCPGIDQTNKMVHVFAEPNLESYRNSRENTIKEKEITSIILQNPEGVCSENTKEDTEAMFIDPISKSGYLIQKVRPRNAVKNPTIFKFEIPTQYLGQKTYVETNRVGTIPDFEATEDLSEHYWPTFITAGDISRDGKMIILRGYRSARVWFRNTISGESVENVLMRKEGIVIPVCQEAQGEAIAIKHDKKGFYTTSESVGEDDATEIDVPIYYYPLL